MILIKVLIRKLYVLPRHTYTHLADVLVTI